MFLKPKREAMRLTLTVNNDQRREDEIEFRMLRSAQESAVARVRP